MNPNEGESTTPDLIDLIYDLQGTLKMLAELMAQDRNNPVSTTAWHYLACAHYYLRSDIAPRIH